MLRAWREFRRGKTNKFEVQNFSLNLSDNLISLRDDLRNNTYKPISYQRFLISDPKLRIIHKANIRDRVLHQAIFRCLYPLFDQRFIHDSYSCRENKGTHRAITRLEQFCRQVSSNEHRPVFALKCDIKKFFDSIDQKILFTLISKQIFDPQTLDLIKIIIDSFCTMPNKGLPLGNVTSQLFANIYLDPFDQFAKHVLKQKRYIRYCDDFIFVSNSQEGLSALIRPVKDFLQRELLLELHPNKISIRKLRQGIDFLGYVVRPYHRILRTKTKNRILRKASREELSKASKQSYLGILSHCYSHKIRNELRLLTK